MGGNLKVFSNWLSEGGNVKIGNIQATPIDMTKIERKSFVKELINNLLILNKTFEKEYGFKIWDDEKYLTSGKAFSGSSEHFINLDITDEEYAKYKKKTGDIDIQLSDQLEKQLHEFFKKYKKFGTMEYIGQSQSAVGQISALFNFKNYKDLKPQVDFEFVSVDDSGKPTPFSHWSRSSAWKDIEQGIKGVAHKFSISCLDHAFTFDINLQKGKKNPKVTKEKVHMFAFSVKNGLRSKYELIDKKTNTWEAIPAKKGNYTKSISEIFETLFHKKATKNDIENFNSFIGVIKMVKKYFDKKQQKDFVDAYIEFLFGAHAQKLYRGDPVTDNTVKKASIDHIEKILKIDMKQYNKIIDKYYKNY